MKVAVNCECEMLQTTLEMFLKESVVPLENAEMVISDVEKDYKKPLFLVSNDNGDLKLPFNKKELLATLTQYENILKTSESINEELKSIDDYKDDFNLVEPIMMQTNDTKPADASFANTEISQKDSFENITDTFTDELNKAISDIAANPPFTYAVGDSFDKAKERQISLLEIKIATLFNEFKNELMKIVKEEILK